MVVQMHENDELSFWFLMTVRVLVSRRMRDDGEALVDLVVVEVQPQDVNLPMTTESSNMLSLIQKCPPKGNVHAAGMLTNFRQSPHYGLMYATEGNRQQKCFAGIALVKSKKKSIK